MKGCLTLPFRLLALALAVVGGYIAWTHRDAIRRRIHEWTAPRGTASRERPAPAPERPGSVGTAVDKLAALGKGGGRDSVILTAGDVASLVAAAAAIAVPGTLDSIAVRLQQDDIEVQARLDTRKLPLSLGPLAGMLREHEPIEAGGRLLFRRAGQAEWAVTRARVRGIPLPREALSRLLHSFNGSAEVVPVPLPPQVGGLRVTEQGVVLYPAGPPR